MIKVNVDCLNAVLLYSVDKIKGEKTKGKASKIVSVGGFEELKTVSDVFSVSSDSLKTYPDLLSKFSDHCVLNVDDFVYCVSGNVDRNWGNPINKVFGLNLKAPNSKWEEVASMTEKRSCFGAAICNGCLVVAGGHNGGSQLHTTELYEPGLNKWSRTASMNKNRSSHGLVVEDQKLFAIGGLARNKCLSSVEQLDNLDGNWSEIKSMNEKRQAFAAAASKNYIYAISGFGDSFTSIFKSVEKYNLKESTWSFVSSINVGRKYHAACVLRGKIYVIGGLDANNEVVKSIECYDPATDEWTVVGEAKEESYRHALVPL